MLECTLSVSERRLLVSHPIYGVISMQYPRDLGSGKDSGYWTRNQTTTWRIEYEYKGIDYICLLVKMHIVFDKHQPF